jgi:hypothetical protein
VSVYFVTCREANAVKIGSSLEPHARLSEIQWGCPLLLKLEAVLPGGYEEEFAFHARFSDVRLRGEWFTINEMIEAIIAVHPAPDLPPDHDRVALAQSNKLGHDVSELRYKRSSALPRRVREAMPKKPTPAFEARHLTREQRGRLASGDIYFPFRTKEPT